MLLLPSRTPPLNCQSHGVNRPTPPHRFERQQSPDHTRPETHPPTHPSPRYSTRSRSTRSTLRPCRRSSSQPLHPKTQRSSSTDSLQHSNRQHTKRLSSTYSVTGRRRYALISNSAGFAAPVHAIVLSRLSIESSSIRIEVLLSAQSRRIVVAGPILNGWVQSMCHDPFRSNARQYCLSTQ